MEITLLNYRNDKIRTKNFPNLDEYDNVLVTVAVIYGDEHITVSNGAENIFGFSSDHAIWPSGFDGSYCVYERNGDNVEVDLLNDPMWQTRKDSYEFLYAAMDAAFEDAGFMN